MEAPSSRRFWVTVAAAGALILAISGCAATAPDHTAPPAEHTIVALGDSIPFNSPNDCPGCTGFVESYAVALGEQSGVEYTTINRSRHDGAKTADIVEELASGSLDDELAGADIVILSIGLNDQPPYDESGAPCGVDQFDTDQQAIAAVLATTPECLDEQTAVLRGRLASILASVRSLAPDAQLFALTGYNTWTGWATLESVDPTTKDAATNVIVGGLQRWRDAVCAEVAAVDGTCVDLFGAFNGSDGVTPSGSLLGPDYAHPSQQGYDRIRDLLLEASGA